MPTRSLALLALLLPLAGCTFQHRTDGGSPIHADNGALEAHREAVEDAATVEIVEPLGAAPAEAPVPTPRLGTVSSESAPATPNGMAPAATAPNGTAPNGTAPNGMAAPIAAPPGAAGAIPPPRASGQ